MRIVKELKYEEVKLERRGCPERLFPKGLLITEKTTCPVCGVLSVSYPGKWLGEPITERRDYMPITLVIRLKPDTRTTYVVEPELERMAVHIRSLDKGKLNYAVDIPLQDTRRYAELLDADSRIEEWHTVVPFFPSDPVRDSYQESAPVCASHVNFADGVADREVWNG